MLQRTARIEDFVEVISEDSKWFGFLGKIRKYDSETLYSKVKVQIFDNVLEFEQNELKLYARKGTHSYDVLEEQEEERKTKALTVEDLNELINFAIDIEDWEYAQELVSRKQDMLAKT